MSTLSAEKCSTTADFETIVHELREKYGQAVYENWFSKLSLDYMNGETLSIFAPTKFVREWIITNYFSEMKKIGEKYGVKKIDISISKQINTTRSGSIEADITPQFDSSFTFANFVEGNQNRVARIAALSISDLSKTNVEFGNWLYIQGDVGVGKTHLLQAIASKIKQDYRAHKVYYVSAENFAQNYVASVRNNDLIRFRENIGSIDVFLFDDIQFTCGKVSTQKEFARTLNILMESNKRIVIASDRSPYSLEIDTRTKSRLSSFMIAEMQRPGIQLRKEIIRKKISIMGQHDFPEDAISFLAENFTSSAREVEGALRRTVTFCNLNNIQATKKVCGDVLQSSLRDKVSLSSTNNIINAVSSMCGISQEDIKSKKRLKNIVKARQFICYLAKELTKLSFQEIGALIGGKNHATVLYSIKIFEEKIKNDPDLSRDLLEVKNKIIAL
ncbi:Chromosomal replication initiator protein DnaA [Candidatus Cyrtobacter comes]|uniref:Chromosomal replication initiator protein DnaA n=1 Tax=Candidatus Cyrtobacter comes TaxID=675776 RepID=A0ABU5L930_9RICK|nr:chromosomal replication initiator protein DnaA [Candidatus Cyrtobacter comes]MDZ5762629.1 Chromosomal replication initiator protein DnaA [Candidatus Cyrtobacter comes]